MELLSLPPLSLMEPLVSSWPFPLDDSLVLRELDGALAVAALGLIVALALAGALVLAHVALLVHPIVVVAPAV